MKVLLYIAAALLVCGAMAACGPSTPQRSANSAGATLIFGGTPGTTFTGAVGTLGASETIQGRVPESRTLSGSGPFTAVIQKKQGENNLTLIVTIRCNDGRERSGQTTASFGVVSIAGSC